ncbi:MAG: hypothetical protein OEU84_11940 [Xanthomonadales bacterium]|nr:hypothetical protein [Xanthomonadales bacterium]
MTKAKPVVATFAAMSSDYSPQALRVEIDVSHTTINPSGVVPVGPELDLYMPNGREQM